MQEQGNGSVGAASAAHPLHRGIPQRDALRLQLALIAGNDPPTRRIELRWRNARGKMARQFFGVREVDRATSAILNVCQLGDTFIGAAPRVRDSGTARDVEHSWVLWVDLDDADALRRLEEFTPAPTMIITTGSGGGHAWWQLNHPLPGPWAQRANRRLAKALGGDLAATDPPRVLRPAGTRNYKHEPPRPVICVRLELDAYTVDQIVGGLPDDRPYTAPAVVRPGRPSGRPLDALAHVVRQAAEGERNRLLYWSSCRAGEHVRAGRFDAESATAALREAALAAGLSETETDRTIHSGLETVTA